MENKYLKLKKKHEKEINGFPMFFAFSNEQLEEGLKKLKTTKENLRSLNCGGFIKSEDIKNYQDMLLNQSSEHKKAMEKELYVYQMFKYELANHEFIITYDYEDTLNSLNLTSEEVDKNKFLSKQLDKAKDDYLKEAEQWA